MDKEHLFQFMPFFNAKYYLNNNWAFDTYTSLNTTIDNDLSSRLEYAIGTRTKYTPKPYLELYLDNNILFNSPINNNSRHDSSNSTNFFNISFGLNIIF